MVTFVLVDPRRVERPLSEPLALDALRAGALKLVAIGPSKPLLPAAAAAEELEALVLPAKRTFLTPRER
jgi:hypothetical protein